MAIDNAEGRLGNEDYLTRKRALEDEIDALEPSARPGIPAA